jgi:hypothetical protein
VSQRTVTTSTIHPRLASVRKQLDQILDPFSPAERRELVDRMLASLTEHEEPTKSNVLLFPKRRVRLLSPAEVDDEAGRYEWALQTQNAALALESARADIACSGLDERERAVLWALAQQAHHEGREQNYSPAPPMTWLAPHYTYLTPAQFSAVAKTLLGATFGGLGISPEPYSYMAPWLPQFIEHGKAFWKPR